MHRFLSLKIVRILKLKLPLFAYVYIISQSFSRFLLLRPHLII